MRRWRKWQRYWPTISSEKVFENYTHMLLLYLHHIHTHTCTHISGSNDKGLVINDTLAEELASRLAQYQLQLAAQLQLHGSRGLLKVLACIHTLLSDTLL